MTMTDHDYRTLPRIANSDLSELKRRLLPSNRTPLTPDAFKFGSAFHKLILEPETCTEQEYADWSEKDYTMLCAMQQAVLTQTDLVTLLGVSQRETVRQWACPNTGLPLKGKLDAVVIPRRHHLIDLKTTSCRSLSKFIDSCFEYDYDRQAAFYLSSEAEATYFEFVGVQKAPPYQVFRLRYHKDDPFVVYGRKKMDYLLQRASEELSKPDGWRPSSWSRIEIK